MKFKKGDIVKISEWISNKNGECIGCVFIVKRMIDAAGTLQKIEVVDYWDKTYGIKFEDDILWFNEDMLEKADQKETDVICLKDMQELCNAINKAHSKPTLKVVAVKHINYKGEKTGKRYYWKTTDDVTIDDIVYMDTVHGLAVGTVRQVYTTLDDIYKLAEDSSKLDLSNYKWCRKSLEVK